MKEMRKDIICIRDTIYHYITANKVLYNIIIAFIILMLLLKHSEVWSDILFYHFIGKAIIYISIF